MTKFYTVVLILATFTLKAQQPKVETPCVILNKLVEDFPNNETQYVGEFIKPTGDEGWGNQNDTKFESKLKLPGARETYFYNELFKNDNIFYTKFYEGADTAMANMEFKRWRGRIDECIYPFGTWATIETEDDIEKKIFFYPFEVSGEMAKKYRQLVFEFKIFKGTKVKESGEVIPNYTVELRIMRDRTQ